MSQVSPVSPDTQQTWSSPQGNGYQGPPSNYLKPWMPKNSFSGCQSSKNSFKFKQIMNIMCHFHFQIIASILQKSIPMNWSKFQCGNLFEVHIELSIESSSIFEFILASLPTCLDTIMHIN